MLPQIAGTRTRAVRVIRVRHSRSVDPISYPQAKVVVVTAGWTTLEHRECSTALAEGDIAILPARALVSGEPLPIAETVTFYLDPSFLEQQLAWTRTTAPVTAAFQAAVEGTGPILSLRPSKVERRTLISDARSLASCDTPAANIDLAFLGATLGFLARIDRVVSPSTSIMPRSEARVVTTALRLDLARRWRVADLSRLANLSGSQLTRVFHTELGASPMQVLARLRVERLAELLLTTSWTVQRCAEAVGWVDPCYATRIMKRIYGITPSEYRKAARSHTRTRF